MKIEMVGGPRDGEVRPLDLRDEVVFELAVRNSAGGTTREAHRYVRTQRATADGWLAYEHTGRVTA